MKKGYDRNYWALLLEGTLFGGGIVALSTGGAVALFIYAMTGSNTLIGLAITFQGLFSTVGHLLGAPYVNAIRKIPQFLIKCFSIQRTIPLFMALPLIFGVSGHNAVGIFLVLFGLFWLTDGFLALTWGELCARAVRSDLRGHMMGMMSTTGGILSLFTGLFVTWLIATPALTDNMRYAYIFMFGSVVLLMTIVCFKFVIDPSPINKPEKANVKQFYAQIPSLIKYSKPLQHVLIARIPSFIGFAAFSFMVVYGKSTLHLSDLQVSWLVYAGLIGGIVSGFILAEASRRFGNKAVILFCSIAAIITLAMAISLTYFNALGYIWLFATCILASFAGNNWFGYFNYFFDIAPDKERPAYQLVGQVIGIPFSFSGLAMGVIVDRFGYVVMFTICAFFAVLTVITSLRLLSRDKITEMHSATNAAK